MAEQQTYQPTEDVDENLKQIQSRANAEKASVRNKVKAVARKVYSTGYRSAAYAGMFGFTGMNARPSEKEDESKDATVAQDDSIFGNEDLPTGVANFAKKRNEMLVKGEKIKTLSFDSVAQNLTPIALLQAKRFGVISADNPLVQQATKASTQYSKDKSVVAVSDVFIPNMNTGKSLPKENYNSLDYVQSEHDFQEAAEHANEYLVTSADDLTPMYEESQIAQQELASGATASADITEQATAPFGINNVGMTPLEQTLQLAQGLTNPTGRGYEDFLVNMDKKNEALEAGIEADDEEYTPGGSMYG